MVDEVRKLARCKSQLKRKSKASQKLNDLPPFTGVLLAFTFRLFGFCAGCGIDRGLPLLAAHPKIQQYSSISGKNYLVSSETSLSSSTVLTLGDGAQCCFGYGLLYLSSYMRNQQEDTADKQHP